MKRSILLFSTFLLFAFTVFAAPAQKYVLTDLISNQATGALIPDPKLVNPWGVTFSPAAGAFWVSNNQTGTATLYTGDVNATVLAKAGLEVLIPGGSPTGVVFNGGNDFVVTNGTVTGPARFIFASESGIISGWNPAVLPNTTAKLGAVIPGASFRGIATGNNGVGNFLYVTDFRNHQIDVFDATFQLVTLEGTFTDPEIPEGFSPFNIQNLGGNLYVTYAQIDESGEEVTGHGRGFVSVFDINGNLKQHLIAQGNLDAPWGIVIAPADFGVFSNALLVGNFGNGKINAFDVNTGAFLGRLKTRPHQKLDGLWALTFGNGISAGDANTLYFSAGPRKESRGLFGSIRVQ